MLGSTSAQVFNIKDYAAIHQEGSTVNFHGRNVTVPKRVLADVDEQRLNMVGRVFSKWLARLVNKHKM